jgi:GTP-binding protein
MEGSVDSNNNSIPAVVIAGRPNVGKSTLFNRLIGKRKSITDPTPGVTRDVVSELFEIGGIKIRLSDTGGVNTSKFGIDQIVSERSIAQMEKADLVLFILDAKGITPEDQIFMEKIRKFMDKTILVVNKVDTPEKENDVWNYYSFGFEKVIPVSSAHGYNIGLLEEQIEEFLEEKLSFSDILPSEEEHVINLAILGKPNTGKSTLSNRLTGTDKSIVSDIPGTTRDIVEGEFLFKNTRFRVMDTAGIRRKSRVTENVEYYSVTRAIKSIDDADLVFIVIDAEEGLSDQDKKIAGHVVKKGKGIIIVINKWDKLKDVPNRMAAVEDRVRFMFPVLDFAPVIPISALTGEGVDNLLKTAFKVNRQLETRVSTANLNKALKEWVEESPPPTSGSRVRYKIRYMTQTCIKPSRFLIFVNKSKGFPPAYIKYIKNKIRKSFGFSAIPFEIDIRETEKTWKEVK